MSGTYADLGREVVERPRYGIRRGPSRSKTRPRRRSKAGNRPTSDSIWWKSKTSSSKAVLPWASPCGSSTGLALLGGSDILSCEEGVTLVATLWAMPLGSMSVAVTDLRLGATAGFNRGRFEAGSLSCVVELSVFRLLKQLLWKHQRRNRKTLAPSMPVARPLAPITGQAGQIEGGAVTGLIRFLEDSRGLVTHREADDGPVGVIVELVGALRGYRL